MIKRNIMYGERQGQWYVDREKISLLRSVAVQTGLNRFLATSEVVKEAANAN